LALGRIEAVLLDSFGTLVAMEPPAPRLARALGVRLDDAERAFRAEIDYYVEHHVAGRDPESLSELRDRCAEVIRSSLGLAALPLAQVRRAMLDSIRFDAYPDARAALRRLRARGVRLVVASNWDCSLPEVLERAGIAPLVDGVVPSAMVGAAKPDPALFEAALRMAGVAAEHALHIGDSVSKDVEGARAAGIEAILLDRARERPEVGPRIESLAELPGLI
jgi:putative hydrolase of the HAD superfamily